MPAIAPTPREMLGLSRDTERTFDRSIEVWRKTETPDGKGSQTWTYARHSSGGGRVSPLLNREGTYVETMYADKLGGRQPFVVTVGHDRVLRLSDQLRSGGVTFEIITIDAPRSYSANRRVIAAEIS
jgi:hypothetical protein